MFVIRRRNSAIAHAATMLITRRSIRRMSDHTLFETLSETWVAWRFDDTPDPVSAAYVGLLVAEVERRRRRRIMRGRCTCATCMEVYPAHR